VQLFLTLRAYSSHTCNIHQPLDDRETNNLPLRSGSTTATAETTAEAGGELAGGTTLLGLLLTATVATLTGSTGATLALLTTHHAARGGVRTLLLDVGSGNNLGGKVEPLAEVVKTLDEANQTRLNSSVVNNKPTSGVRV
jgi:hypothetical protein